MESPALSPPGGRQHFRRNPLLWPPSCHLLFASTPYPPADSQPYFTRAVNGGCLITGWPDTRPRRTKRAVRWTVAPRHLHSCREAQAPDEETRP
eukprot:1534529-Karenia_brevis.AAC.1